MESKNNYNFIILILLVALIGSYVGGRNGQKEAEIRAKRKVVEDIQRDLDYNQSSSFSIKNFIFG